MRRIVPTVLACAALLVVPVTVDAEDEPRTPVLLELFTSEGCSSCPPADEHVARLVRVQPLKQVRIIALSQHVDYWNDLGWRDPFSSAAFSERQRDYARLLETGVYTPQLVVDGAEVLVGSDRELAMRAIARAAKRPKIPLAVGPPSVDGDALEFSVRVGDPPAGLSGKWILWTAVAEDGLTVAVKRGENGGRELRHDGVARDLQEHGTVEPGDAVEVRVPLEASWNRDGLRVVAFLERRGDGRIVGVGTSP